jgi:predicted phosphoribosyltransferase
MLAAIQAVREQGAGSVAVAVPVGPERTCRAIADEADEVVCVLMPRPFVAVGRWYEDFSEVGDEDVQRLLGA